MRLQISLGAFSAFSSPFLRGGKKPGRRSAPKLIIALLLLVPPSLPACSTLPAQEKNLPPRPILESLAPESRGGETGAWMNDADAASLGLYIEYLEDACR